MFDTWILRIKLNPWSINVFVFVFCIFILFLFLFLGNSASPSSRGRLLYIHPVVGCHIKPSMMVRYLIYFGQVYEVDNPSAHVEKDTDKHKMPKKTQHVLFFLSKKYWGFLDIKYDTQNHHFKIQSHSFGYFTVSNFLYLCVVWDRVIIIGWNLMSIDPGLDDCQCAAAPPCNIYASNKSLPACCLLISRWDKSFIQRGDWYVCLSELVLCSTLIWRKKIIELVWANWMKSVFEIVSN